MTTTQPRDVNLVSLLWAGGEAAGEIARLHASLLEPGWDEAAVTKLLEHPGATTLIARTGFPKISVGFAMGQVAAAGQSIGRAISTDLDDRAAQVHYRPTAVALLRAADRMPCLGPLLPLYLRPPDVKSQADKSLPWSA